MRIAQIDPDLVTIRDDDGRLLATLIGSRHNGVAVIDMVAEPGAEVHESKFSRQATLLGAPSIVVSRE